MIRQFCLSTDLSCFRHTSFHLVPEKVQSLRKKRSNILSNSSFTAHMISVLRDCNRTANFYSVVFHSKSLHNTCSVEFNLDYVTPWILRARDRDRDILARLRFGHQRPLNRRCPDEKYQYVNNNRLTEYPGTPAWTPATSKSLSRLKTTHCYSQSNVVRLLLNAADNFTLIVLTAPSSSM